MFFSGSYQSCCMLHSNIQNQIVKNYYFLFQVFSELRLQTYVKHLPDQLIAMILTDQILIINFNFSVKVESVETDNEQTKDSISSTLDNK